MDKRNLRFPIVILLLTMLFVPAYISLVLSSTGYIRINGTTFGNLPLVADVKLRVEDSPNSAGVILDIIRVMKLALDRGISGRLESISSFSFKHPFIQPPSDVIAKQWVTEFIEGKRER